MNVFDWIVTISSWIVIGIGAFGFLALIFAIIALIVMDFVWHRDVRGDDDD